MWLFERRGEGMLLLIGLIDTKIEGGFVVTGANCFVTEWNCLLVD